MAALGQGGVTILAGANHGQLSPITLTAGQTLVFDHGLNRRAFQVIVSSGADANFGQLLQLPVAQPLAGGRYDTIAIENDTLATVQVFVACRWEENSVEASYIASGDARLEIQNPPVL